MPPFHFSDALHGPAAVTSRRSWLRSGGLLTCGVLLGCERSLQNDAAPSTAARTDVPLRVAFVGAAAEIDGLKRTWQAVSELPLDVQPISPDNLDAAALQTQIDQAATQSDCLIVPRLVLAHLYANERISELGPDWDSDTAERSGGFLTALQNGASMYAGQPIAAPLGCRLPAILSTGDPPEVTTWAEYEDAVRRVDGKAAEPLAEGWCGYSFLLRASSAVPRGWLFSRDEMTPRITEKPYVAALDQMRQTVQAYGETNRRLDAGEVGKRVLAGELQLGIGTVESDPGDAILSIGRLPVVASAEDADQRSTASSRQTVSPLMLPPWIPVGVISRSCRQTASARRFLAWLSGGEGVESFRSLAGRFVDTREGVDSTAMASSPSGPLQAWQRNQLSRSLVRPITPLIRGVEYYAALDKAVSRCVHDGAAAQESLQQASDTWSGLTAEVGVEKQRRAWRRV